MGLELTPIKDVKVDREIAINYLNNNPEMKILFEKLYRTKYCAKSIQNKQDTQQGSI